MDSYYSAKVSPSVYRTKAECDENGYRPKVVPFTCISQKSASKETFTVLLSCICQKGIKNKSVPLAIYLHGECEWSGGAE